MDVFIVTNEKIEMRIAIRVFPANVLNIMVYLRFK